MKKKYTVLFLVIVILTAAGCSGREKKSDEGAKAGTAAPENGRTELKLRDGSGEQTDKTAEQGKEDSPAVSGAGKAGVAPPEGQDLLLYYGSLDGGVLPGDMEIGELHDLKSAAGAGAAEVIGAFLSSVSDGITDRRMFASVKADLLEKRLSEVDVSGLESWRVGRLDLDSSPVSARVRLFGKNSVTGGEIYLILENGWKIYDFSIDFEKLERPYIREEIYTPEVYDLDYLR